jgi:hypothetical protein
LAFVRWPAASELKFTQTSNPNKRHELARCTKVFMVSIGGRFYLMWAIIAESAAKSASLFHQP